jgi:hypothetical protein
MKSGTGTWVGRRGRSIKDTLEGIAGNGLQQKTKLAPAMPFHFLVITVLVIFFYKSSPFFVLTCNINRDKMK